MKRRVGIVLAGLVEGSLGVLLHALGGVVAADDAADERAREKLEKIGDKIDRK